MSAKSNDAFRPSASSSGTWPDIASARWRWILSAVASTGLLSAPLISAVTRAEDGASPANPASQLDRTNARIAELNAQIGRDRSHSDELQKAVEDAERAVLTARDDARRASADADAQQQKLRQAEAQRNEAEHHLEQAQKSLAAQLRAAFEIGDDSRTGTLVGDDDAGRASRMVGYYDELDRQRVAQIHEVQADLQALQALQARYAGELDELRQREADRHEALNRVVAAKQDRSKAVEAMKARLSDESVELQRQQAAEKQLRDVIESARRSEREDSVPPLEPGLDKPFPELRGHLAWPLRGQVLANFGDLKPDGHLQWKGIWIGAEEGTPVRSCARGRVAYVGWMSRYGQLIVLEHEGGYFSLYAHAASISKATGQRVAAGEAVATAGTTGGYDRAGIYFEMRKGTEPIDPRTWLPK
jgi:septal ring factor EnvC (AmiA/AmiB activator)